MYREMHPNGKQKSEATYVNGVLIGLAKTWYPSGAKMRESTYYDTGA